MKQNPVAELLTNMSNKTSFLSQWDYIINCSENKNDNQKMDQDVDIETDMKNVACLRQIVSILQ